MINVNEIVGDLNKIISKVKWCINTYPNNDIWPKVYGNLITTLEQLKMDNKIYKYD